ncbi:MAG: amidohydrolase family protein, partial [Clostridia bacterium]|nr:amidohydrolase family protein [Clostridia bacterium]
VTKVGVPFTQAVDYATINPARMIGIDNEAGSIAIGKRADFTVINENYDVLYTVCGGKVIYKA